MICVWLNKNSTDDTLNTALCASVLLNFYYLQPLTLFQTQNHDPQFWNQIDASAWIGTAKFKSVNDLLLLAAVYLILGLSGIDVKQHNVF